MKNSDTVQLVVIIIALIAGYHALVELPQFLWLLIRWFNEGLTLTGSFSTVLASMIYLAINIFFVILLIGRSSQITRYVVEKSSYTGELKIPQTKFDLISVVFIAIGIFILITGFPDFFMNLYSYYKEKTSNDLSGYGVRDLGYISPGNSLPALAIEIILALIVIVYSQQFADYFGKKIRNRDLIEEIGSPEINKEDVQH